MDKTDAAGCNAAKMNVPQATPPCYRMKVLQLNAMARRVSVMMADEFDIKIGQLAECCHCSYTEAMHHLLWHSFRGGGTSDLNVAKKMRGSPAETIRLALGMTPDNYVTTRAE